MNQLRQIGEITWMNLQSVPQRWAASLVIVVGIAGVVGVLVAMLSMSTGLTRTLSATGRMDRAIVMRAGSNAELSSFLDRANTTLVMQDPSVARASDGLPLASAELIVITEVPRKGQYVRMIAAEFCRIASHLIAFGTYGIDIGANTPFFYAFREREDLRR